MNANNTEIIKTLITVLGGGLFMITGAIIAGLWAWRSQIGAKKIETDANREIKIADGEASLKVKIVDDRAGWEARVLDQYERLDKKMQGLEELLDEERKQRRLLETTLHLSEIKLSDMQKEIEILQNENKNAQEQLIRLADDSRTRQKECEERIIRLTDELASAHEKLSVANTDREAFRTHAEHLQEELAFLKTQVSPSKHRRTPLSEIKATVDDTNERVKVIEEGIEGEKPQ